MPIVLYCKKCTRKVAEIRYSSRKGAFTLISKDIERDFLHLEEALNFLYDKIARCPHCKKTLKNEEKSVKV